MYDPLLLLFNRIYVSQIIIFYKIESLSFLQIWFNTIPNFKRIILDY